MKNLKGFLQSCNKSLINQACSGPYWENISPRSFLYGPSAARSVLSRPRADILPVRPSRLVNKIYVNKHVKICSKHFRPEDFINPEAKKRRLKRDVVPSIFTWSDESPETVARSAVEKLNTSRQEEEEATDTASEGEGEETFTLSGLTLTSRKTHKRMISAMK